MESCTEWFHIKDKVHWINNLQIIIVETWANNKINITEQSIETFKSLGNLKKIINSLITKLKNTNETLPVCVCCRYYDLPLENSKNILIHLNDHIKTININSYVQWLEWMEKLNQLIKYWYIKRNMNHNIENKLSIIWGLWTKFSMTIQRAEQFQWRCTKIHCFHSKI